MTRTPLLEVVDLTVAFRTRTGVVRALDRVALTVGRGETVGVVGESGSGKSVTAYAVMGLLDAAADVGAGHVRFGNVDLLALGEAALRNLRGREIAMIFQNPRVALNPIRSVGRQIEDVLTVHGDHSGRGDKRLRAIEWLAKVRIPDPERRYHAYPFQLSGGMCQRVMIALALACRPSLLIADEPTTGLDVTTQATIMDMLAELARAEGMATLLITHDLGLAAEHCERMVVMHAGHVVETAPTAALFATPSHPYTCKLIATTPRPGATLADLTPIPGGLPDLRGPLPPCRYLARCEIAAERCAQERPPRVGVGTDHHVLCHAAGTA